MKLLQWPKEHGVRKGVACWLCDHCLRHHPEKWTRIEHREDCPNADLMRERYREVEGKAQWVTLTSKSFREAD